MLERIAYCIRNNENILEKKEIKPIIQFINNYSYKSKRIFSDIGEDSAAIKNSNSYILVTTDRIKTEFVENFPFGAGFSSILVGVDDIYCCGGKPIAVSIILSYVDSDIGQRIIEGICEGSQKFQVPIIRGHTKPDSSHYELSSTVIGEIKKENYISALNAKVNDDIILAVDFNGKVGQASKYYWDTVTFKSTSEVLQKRESMNLIAEKHLANSSKDISNGGIFGTLLQLIKYSNIGANVNINYIDIPEVLIKQNYTLEEYIQMYLTTSYILTTPKAFSQQILDIFSKFGLNSRIIGKIIKENELVISNGKESLKVFNY